MKNFIKGKLGTALIIVVTLVLAGIAVFTAYRLYELRQQPVAPNVPSSMPKAQEDTTGANVAPNCHKVYTVTTIDRPTPTPVVVSCNVNCNLTVTPQIRCETGLVCEPPTIDAEDGISGISEGVGGLCRNPDCPEETDCVCPGNPTATPTTNPTITPTPTPTSTTRPTATATPTAPPGEPNSCGGTCGSNYNCKSGFYCYNGYCRNPSCPTDTDCECSEDEGGPTATPTSGSNLPGSTPTEAALPQSGTNWPTFVGAAVGVLIIMGALLLAF